MKIIKLLDGRRYMPPAPRRRIPIFDWDVRVVPFQESEDHPITKYMVVDMSDGEPKEVDSSSNLDDAVRKAQARARLGPRSVPNVRHGRRS